ncbi:MAG: ATP synthase F1 subunit epsilon [Patescibacteria group bacterium]|nr:ATP synthase F1 subunit epsilon [Patescibacteria group bacterium]
MKLNFQIITPDKIIFQDEADAITVPATDGQITILPNHIPLVSVTKPGEIIIKKGNETKNIAVMRGFIENSQNNVRLMADAAELAEDIDERRAQEAKERAQKAKETTQDHLELAEATAALERALVRIKIAQRKKSRHI